MQKERYTLPKSVNLGCGYDHREGWLNVDSFDACKPDLLDDLETFPWELPSHHFEHVLLKHVLEHLGAEFAVFQGVMREIHRIAAPGGLIEIHVPHHRHDNFWSDPTHVRAFTPLTFQMMSKKHCDDWIARGVGNTMLAQLMDVDFEVEQIVQVYDPAWYRRHTEGLLSMDQLREAALTHWGVVRELQVRLRAVK
jgi:hypothetical protein